MRAQARLSALMALPFLAVAACGNDTAKTAATTSAVVADDAAVSTAPVPETGAEAATPDTAPSVTPAKNTSLKPPSKSEARISDVKYADTVSAGDMVLGKEGAPLTIVEYASLTCAHCATFHATIVPMIKEEFVKTGKAILIFRDFPTPPAQLAYAGAVLARCTADRSGIDGYFAVLGSLFNNQKAWAFGDTPKKSLLKIMAQTGMTEPDFQDCLGRQDIVDAMNASIKEASEDFNVDSTPSVFVNGEKMRFASVDQYRDGLNAAYKAATAARADAAGTAAGADDTGE